MPSGKIIMSLVMLAIFAVMVGIALQYPPQARFMPLVVGLPAIALCLLQIFLEFRDRRRSRVEAPAESRSGFERAGEEVERVLGHKIDLDVAHETLQIVQSDLPEAGETRRELLLWGCFVGLVASLIVFGFWPTIPVFLAAFVRFYAKESWRFAIGLSAVATAVLFLVFHKGLAIILHGGFVTDYLLDRFWSG